MTHKYARWAKPGVFSGLLLTALLPGILAGCPRGGSGEEPTTLPGIHLEDFGTGINLLQNVDAAGSASGYASLEKWVLAREDLIGRNPYGEKSQGKDLVVAITSSLPEGFKATNDGGEVVVELRVFPDIENSKITLQGKLLVELSPAAVEELLGKALTNDKGADGNSHLTFLLTSGGKEDKFSVRMVTSHRVNGRCYAASLALNLVQ